jgi:hypothetical protein
MSRRPVKYTAFGKVDNSMNEIQREAAMEVEGPNFYQPQPPQQIILPYVPPKSNTYQTPTNVFSFSGNSESKK